MLSQTFLHMLCSWNVPACVCLHVLSALVCHGLASANGMLHVCVCVSLQKPLTSTDHHTFHCILSCPLSYLSSVQYKARSERSACTKFDWTARGGDTVAILSTLCCTTAHRFSIGDKSGLSPGLTPFAQKTEMLNWHHFWVLVQCSPRAHQLAAQTSPSPCTPSPAQDRPVKYIINWPMGPARPIDKLI